MVAHDPTLRTALVLPLALIRHVEMPTLPLARAQTDWLGAQIQRGARGLLLQADIPWPPPPRAALGHFRRKAITSPGLETITLVIPSVDSLIPTLVASVAQQVMSLGQLAGGVATFTKLEAALDWHESKLGLTIDRPRVASTLDTLGA